MGEYKWVEYLLFKIGWYKCFFPYCEKRATEWVYSAWFDNSVPLCEIHRDLELSRHNPEYDVQCPHCDCWFGVN